MNILNYHLSEIISYLYILNLKYSYNCNEFFNLPPEVYIALIPSGMITANAVPTSKPAPNTVTNFNLSFNVKNGLNVTALSTNHIFGIKHLNQTDKSIIPKIWNKHKHDVHNMSRVIKTFTSLFGLITVDIF